MYKGKSVTKDRNTRNESSFKPKKKYDKPSGFSKNNEKVSKPIKKRKTYEVAEEFEEDSLVLIGRNAVLEAINGDKPVDKIFVKKGAIEGSLKVIIAKAKEKRIVVQEADVKKLDSFSAMKNHQGVVALCPAHEYVSIEDMLENAKKKNEDPFIIILDGITDPHNLGAIIRTANACGAHGVIIPKRRAATLTGIVSKTSAGAIEHVMISRVSNIVQAVEKLKKAGVWVAGADMSGRTMLKSELKGPIALIIGDEGLGISRIVKDNCDFMVSIPLKGEIASLNASVAAGVLMYEVLRTREQ